jgi:hypothetical protein
MASYKSNEMGLGAGELEGCCDKSMMEARLFIKT